VPDILRPLDIDSGGVNGAHESASRKVFAEAEPFLLLEEMSEKQSHRSRDHRYCAADEGLDEYTKETRLGQK
jgi:hypothetical protein